MPDRRVESPKDGATRPSSIAAARDRSPTGPAPEGVPDGRADFIRLQRLAGNRAVTGLLAGRSTTDRLIRRKKVSGLYVETTKKESTTYIEVGEQRVYYRWATDVDTDDYELSPHNNSTGWKLYNLYKKRPAKSSSPTKQAKKPPKQPTPEDSRSEDETASPPVSTTDDEPTPSKPAEIPWRKLGSTGQIRNLANRLKCQEKDLAPIAAMGYATVDALAKGNKVTLEQMKGLYEDLGGSALLEALILLEATKTHYRDLYKYRNDVRTLLDAKLDPATFARAWYEVANGATVAKLWESKRKTEDIVGLVERVPAKSLKNLLKDIDSGGFWQLIDRLGQDQMGGLGKGVEGKTLEETAGAGKDPGERDLLLQELGTNHAGTLAKVHGRLAQSDLKDVLRTANQTAASIAELLDVAADHRWLGHDNISQFLAAAALDPNPDVGRLAKIAKQFAAAGNTGQFVQAQPGAGGPDRPAVRTKDVDGEPAIVASGDIDHYMAGHSYAAYVATRENITRSPVSSMFPADASRQSVAGSVAQVMQDQSFVALVRRARVARNGMPLSDNIGGYAIGVQCWADRTRVSQFYPTNGGLDSSALKAVFSLMTGRDFR